jgi:hypothetical protein
MIGNKVSRAWQLTCAITISNQGSLTNMKTSDIEKVPINLGIGYLHSAYIYSPPATCTNAESKRQQQ